MMFSPWKISTSESIKYAGVIRTKEIHSTNSSFSVIVLVMKQIATNYIQNFKTDKWKVSLRRKHTIFLPCGNKYEWD